jgi:aryl-alcohol dehydrogenase-like predicted oxidoreductase
MSLRRLGVERIDLWQLHRIDPHVPADEQLGVIREMQDEGLIRQVGLSEVNVDELRAAQRILDVVSVQNLYNVSNRSSEDLLTHCGYHGIGFIPWFPLGARSLVGDHGPLAPLAAAAGCTPSQAALAWLLQHSPVLLPIPGTGSVEHLQENCDAALVTLDEATIAALDDLPAGS